MKIVRELEQDERESLLDDYKNHPLIRTHVGPVIMAEHSFIVNLDPGDYRKIYICANIPNSVDVYRTLYDVVKYIEDHPEFLYQSSQFHPSKQWYSGRLSGIRVQEYLSYFSQGSRISSLGGCFVLDIAEKQRGEVMDGMHRLVAYGLATHLNKRRFPVQVFLGTNRSIKDIKYLR